MKKIILFSISGLLLIALIYFVTSRPTNIELKYPTKTFINNANYGFDAKDIDLTTSLATQYLKPMAKTSTVNMKSEQEVLKVANDFTKELLAAPTKVNGEIAFQSYNFDPSNYDEEGYEIDPFSTPNGFGELARREFFVYSVYKYFVEKNLTYEKIIAPKINFAENNVYIVETILEETQFSYQDNKGKQITSVKSNILLQYEVVKNYDLVRNCIVYKVHSIEVSLVDDLEKYYQKTYEQERNTNTNALSINKFINTVDGFSDITALEKLSDKTLKNFYNKNSASNVIVLAYNTEGAMVARSNGFFIKKGVIVTSWDYVEDIINTKDAHPYIVTDKEKTYTIEGVITADPINNIAILKLKEEVGTPIIVSKDNIALNDPVISLTSSSGIKMNVMSGIYLGKLDGKLSSYKISIPMVEMNLGSALYNLKGEVIGINNQLSTTTLVLPISNLNDTITSLKDETFSNIKITTFDDLRDKYTLSITEDEINNDYDKKLWSLYETIPDFNSKNYLVKKDVYSEDNILTITYQNPYQDLIGADFYIESYQEKLLNDGFKKEKGSYVKNNIELILTTKYDLVIVILIKK